MTVEKSEESKSQREKAMPESSRRARSFEDLHVFKEARKLVSRIYALTSDGVIRKDYGLVDQMRRAAVSILSNIAEGFERETDAEFIRSLYIAKGSCGELRAQAIVSFDQKHWSAEVFSEIENSCRRLSAGLSNLIRYLKRSPKKVG